MMEKNQIEIFHYDSRSREKTIAWEMTPATHQSQPAIVPLNHSTPQVPLFNEQALQTVLFYDRTRLNR